MLKKRRLFKTSYIIMGLLFMILTISVVKNSFILQKLNNYTEHNAFLINRLGQIRGETQRYAKFFLINDKNKMNMLKTKIDNLYRNIDFYINNYPLTIRNEFLNNFIGKYKKSHKIWELMKKCNNKKTLLKLSETEWNVTNNVTSLMAKISDCKLKKLKEFIIYLTVLNVIILGILILFVFYFVKKGLEEATVTDPLTKLYNRFYFDIQYNYFVKKYQRYKTPFSAFLFDIDNFKTVNDSFGHQKGDEVLVKIAEIIKKSIRDTDFAFRYGGEEFIILFPDTDLKNAKTVAERIRKRIEENIILDNGKPVTISGGVEQYCDKFDMETFLRMIDDMLYQAKESGKNKIIFA